MESTRSGRTWTLIGTALLALTIGVMARRSVLAPRLASEEMRDAVAAPISPALLGGARVIQPNTGYFASPSGRRAEAELALMSSRMSNASKTMHARAAKMRREAARERLVPVSAR